MAKKKEINEDTPKITSVQKKDLPKLIISLVVLLVAVYFIITSPQLHVVKGADTKALDIAPKPVALNPELGADLDKNDRPDVLEKIFPCNDPLVAFPDPGENCLETNYLPGADPLADAEGRLDPFQKR